MMMLTSVPLPIFSHFLATLAVRVSRIHDSVRFMFRECRTMVKGESLAIAFDSLRLRKEMQLSTKHAFVVGSIFLQH